MQIDARLGGIILLFCLAVATSLAGCGKSKVDIGKEDADRQARAIAAAEILHVIRPVTFEPPKRRD